MEIQIELRSDSGFTTKKVEVSAPTILSLLSIKSVQEICEKLGVDSHRDLDGYVVSITDKD